MALRVRKADRWNNGFALCLLHFHGGLAKGFLQSLLAFCPPPPLTNFLPKKHFFLKSNMVEVGILPTEICWLLFVKPPVILSAFDVSCSSPS
nr:hypothetical protein Itr_chr10CG08130 [Ipomoea trifida]